VNEGPSDVLRARFAAIDSRLERPMTHADRELLKTEIIALFRAVDRQLEELTSLKREIKGLIDKWKGTAEESGENSVERGAGSVDTAAPSAESQEQVDARRSTLDAPPAENAAPRAESREPRAAPPRVDHLGASTYIERGWSRISLGDYVGAEESLEHALQLAPGDSQAEALLGWAQMLQDRYDIAMLNFHKVLVREPNNSLARINVGYICLRKGIFGEAIEHLTRAIRLDNDRKATLYAHHYLGLLYLEREMYDDSVGFFRKALELGPNLIEAYFEMGRALWFGGRQDEAREAWRAGAAANKFNAWGKRCAELLESVEQGGAPPRMR
jgi:tetratricopeptide (TPR) repeat protein